MTRPDPEPDDGFNWARAWVSLRWSEGDEEEGEREVPAYTWR